ncbi:MAG: SxtJ family membrane protein [Parvularculaceae bacterium]|nr:SxtJ family membrane protein [Parvularculaceae bacterium]
MSKSRLAPHEAMSAGEALKLPSNRNFGLVVGTAAITLGLLLGLKDGAIGPLSVALIALGSGLNLLGLTAPSLLTAPNRLWMKLGLLLGLIMTPVIMGLVYVTTFLPIALLMRLKGHDPLRRARKAAGESYWIVRTPPGPDPATMPNQF